MDLSGLRFQSISISFWIVIFWQWPKAATEVRHRNPKGKAENTFPCAQIPARPGLFYTILSNPKKEVMFQGESHTPSKVLMVSKTRGLQHMSKGDQGAGWTLLLQTQLYSAHCPASAGATHHQCSWEPNHTSRTHLYFRKKRRARLNLCSNCHSPCCKRFSVLQIWWRGRQEKKNKVKLIDNNFPHILK